MEKSRRYHGGQFHRVARTSGRGRVQDAERLSRRRLRFFELDGPARAHPQNPLLRVTPADTRDKQGKRRAFSDEELSKLLAVAGKHRPLYLAAAYTGLRLGELRQLGLTEEDAETVELLIELRVGGRRLKDTNALLNQVGNLLANTPDRDYEVELEDGAKLKGSDFVLKTSGTVECEGGVPKTHSVWKEMARYLKELQESKKVIA